MATNQAYDSYNLPVACSDPATPASGDPVRYGSWTGVALTKEGEGGNTSTQATVDFGPRTWSLSVKAVDGSGNSAVAVGDAIYYVDADTPKLSKKNTGYLFGFALEAIDAGATKTIKVFHTPPAFATPANGTLDGAKASNVANANVVGGIPVVHRIDCADAAADVDTVITYKERVIDAWGLNTGVAAHATTDTWQVKNGANAISDAVAKTATVNAVKRIATIDPAQAEIAAGGTLRITTAKGAGALNAAVTVYVLCLRVA